MTLTELRYMVALTREKHFGRAAQSCHVSQPTLSLAIKKLEEELNVKLFERTVGKIFATRTGEKIACQAQIVLEQADRIKEISQPQQDAVSGPLSVGSIYTIGPYLLPNLVHQILSKTPQMPLILQENFTAQLLEMLHNGELDCAILAEPFSAENFAVAPLYDEPFWAVVPKNHPFAERKNLSSEELQGQSMLLLGNGHCFRDHVLTVCPEFTHASDLYPIRNNTHSEFRKNFEGSSLETIKHMVAAGMGITLVPRLSVPEDETQSEYIRYIPVTNAQAQPPMRRVVLVWRRSFTRYEAIAALRNAIYSCALLGVTRLT